MQQLTLGVLAREQMHKAVVRAGSTDGAGLERGEECLLLPSLKILISWLGDAAREQELQNAVDEATRSRTLLWSIEQGRGVERN
jgi:hypothetical protein